MAAICNTSNMHLISPAMYTVGYNKIKLSEKITFTADAGYTPPSPQIRD